MIGEEMVGVNAFLHSGASVAVVVALYGPVWRLGEWLARRLP